MASPESKTDESARRGPAQGARRAGSDENARRAGFDESARRARGLVTVSRLTDRLTRTALGKRGFADVAIIARWPEIVGADLAAFACPLQVKYPKGRNAGATLLLRVSSSAAAALLQLKTPTILARVNGFLGYAAVTRLEASHGPLPKPPAKTRATPAPVPSATVEAATAAIASQDLRDALRKLGARLQQRPGRSVVSQADSPDSGPASSKEDPTP